MKNPIERNVPRAAGWAGALALVAGLAHAGRLEVGAFAEPPNIAETLAPADWLAGDAMGHYVLPEGAAGTLTALLMSDGEAAYRLEADLTTYLTVWDPRQPRYGGVEGVLISVGQASCVATELRVVGGWSRMPGEAAELQAHVLEVNAVTGTVYGMVGALQGTFMPVQPAARRPGSAPRVASAVRFDGSVQGRRALDAQPPEQGCSVDDRRYVRVDRFAPRREVPRDGGGIPPPPRDGGVAVPARQAWDVDGVPAGTFGGALASTVTSGVRPHVGPILDRAGAEAIEVETGFFYGTWALHH